MRWDPLTADHGVAQRPGQAVEHRSPQQERADLRRKAVQHLCQEVVHDLAVVAGERLDERRWFGPAAQRQPGQVQAGGPPLGALLQRTDVRRPEGQAQRPVQQRGRLGLGETKIIGPDLEHLAPRPQPGQRQSRVGPSGQGQAESRGEVLDQESHRTEDVPAGDQMIVIEHQRHRRGQNRPVR